MREKSALAGGRRARPSPCKAHDRQARGQAAPGTLFAPQRAQVFLALGRDAAALHRLLNGFLMDPGRQPPPFQIGQRRLILLSQGGGEITRPPSCARNIPRSPPRRPSRDSAARTPHPGKKSISIFKPKAHGVAPPAVQPGADLPRQLGRVGGKGPRVQSDRTWPSCPRGAGTAPAAPPSAHTPARPTATARAGCSPHNTDGAGRPDRFPAPPAAETPGPGGAAPACARR